jgi:hypothetical protein
MRYALLGNKASFSFILCVGNALQKRFICPSNAFLIRHFFAANLITRLVVNAESMLPPCRKAVKKNLKKTKEFIFDLTFHCPCWTMRTGFKEKESKLMPSSVAVHKLKPDRSNHRMPSAIAESALRERTSCAPVMPDWHFIDMIHELGGEIIRTGQFLRQVYYVHRKRPTQLQRDLQRAYTKRRKWKRYLEMRYGIGNVKVKKWRTTAY